MTAYVSGSSNTGTDSVTVTAPATIVAGNLLVAVVYTWASSTGDPNPVTTPSGWTEAGSYSDNSWVQWGVVFTKLATGSEPGSYTFVTGTDSEPAAAVILQYSGTGGALDGSPVFGGSPTATTSAAAPSITPIDSTDVWVTFFGSAGYGDAPSFSTPSGMTARAHTTVNLILESFDETLSSSSATGTASSTQSASYPYLSISLLIAPGGTASGAGAMTFSGSGTATASGVASGAGAMTFSGSGTAVVVPTVAASGTGALTFSGSGTATPENGFLALLGSLQYLVAFNNDGLDDFTAFTVATPPGTLGTAGKWTDITPYIYDHSIQARGRQHDTDAFEAGQVNVTADNTTGAFSPWNTSGPFYGTALANGDSSLLMPRRLFQVRCNLGGTPYYRITGHVASYAPVWSDPFTAWSQIQAYDPLRLFNTTNLLNAYIELAVSTSPTGLWRFNDASGTTAVALVGPNNGVYEADFTLGANGPINGDPSTAVTVGASSDGYVSLGGNAGVTGSTYSIAVWINPASASVEAYTVYYQFSGSLHSQTGFIWLLVGIEGEQSQLWLSGNGVGSTATLLQGGTGLAADEWHLIVCTVDATTNVGKMYMDGADVGASPAGPAMPAIPTSSAQTIFGVNPSGTNPITGGADGNPSWNGGLGNAALYNTVLTAAQVLDLWEAGVFLEAEALSGTQMGTVLANVDWPTAAQDLDAGVSTIQGSTGTYDSGQYGTTTDLSQTAALSYIQGIEQTEAGAFFPQASGVMRFVDRSNLYSASPWTTSQATLGDNPTEIHYLANPELPKDDTDLYTQATIQPQGLALVSYTAAAAVTKQLGVVTWQPNNTLLQTTIAEAQAYCQWVVETHESPTTRIDSIVIDMLDVLALDGGAPGTHTKAVLSLDLMQRVTVNRHHLPGGTVFSQEFVIEQISESVSLGTTGEPGWTITFALAAPLAAPTF